MVSTLKETITNNTHIDRAKETVNNIKESMQVDVPMLEQMVLSPIAAPAPVTVGQNQYNQSHEHNNSYNINVTSMMTENVSPTSLANTIRDKIVDTKAIEKANINKVIAPYKDS